MSALTTDKAFQQGLRTRHLRGSIWRLFFRLSTVIAILALIALFLNIVDSAFGYTLQQYDVPPAELAPDGNIDQLTNEQLVAILTEYQPRRVAVYVRTYLSAVADSVFTQLPLRTALAGHTVPEELADSTISELTPEQVGSLLTDNATHEQLVAAVEEGVVGIDILETWSLWDSLTRRAAIEAEAAETPGSSLVFKSWLTADFISATMSSNAAIAGIRTALLGSLWVMGITILFAFPVGVGAAIYLEEYATDTPLNNLIETNIRNLAGVPSIIYGLLGLAIFVRALESLTAGRTIFSAGFTMGLLILPVIIINSQEAIRAVPSSIREASFGIGATKWQTIWNQVLPASIPGILTGTILAISRAIGETAPLIVIGASTFIVFDPSSPISKFTALPIQIYSWTARPQAEFRAVAAGAIIVLLILLLAMNATAIILRQRFRRNLSA
jgi:phosphate transport system permease protein